MHYIQHQRRSRYLVSTGIGAALLLLALAPTQAAAQEAAGPAVSGSTGLEDIVVTAERREQRLQDVPIAATVFSGNEIARRGIANIADIQQAAPAVAINTVNRSTFINIRGVGLAQASPTSSPGVAYYIDGQLIPHEIFIGMSFYDIGSIEVLRGPQGTLSGQNSTGGAIYVRTPEPRFGEVSGFLEQTIANYNAYRTIGAINLSSGENVAVRISAIHDERDSFTRNIGSKSQPGNLNLDAVRINLALRSDDERLRINVRGEYFDYKSDNIAIKNRLDAVTSEPFVIEEDARSYLNQRGYRLSAELRYGITDGVELRALTSWQSAYTHDQNDGDRTATALPVPPELPANGANTARFPGRITRSTIKFNTWINEVNLLSTGKGPLNWVVGAFRLSETSPLTTYRDYRNTQEFGSYDQSVETYARNRSQSLFGQVNWFVTPTIELLAGARYNWDRQIYARSIYAGPPPAPAPFVSTAKSTALTGKLGVNIHTTGGTLVYLTASRGYKAGGVNLTANTPSYRPEKNTVYEAGVKAELFDKHLRTNASIFYSRYQNIQFNSLFEGLALFQNAGSSEAWGGELEVTGQFGGLSFNLGAGYLNAEFSEGTCLNNGNNRAGSPDVCPSSGPTSADQFVPKGARMPLSPKWTVNAGIQYAFDLGGDLSLTPRFQWSHLSTQLATPFPSFATIVPKRDVFDARLTLDVGKRYRLEGFVTNFTNKKYIASQIQDAGAGLGGFVYGAPRQYGVRGTFRF